MGPILDSCQQLRGGVTPEGVPWAELGCPNVGAKVELAVRMAADGARRIEVRRAAETMTRGAVASCDRARAIQVWVQRHVAYVDELGELFAMPIATLRHRAGDCDDHAILVAALLVSLGETTAIGFVAPSHVVAYWRWRNTWIPLETTIPANFGEPPLAAARRLGLWTRADITGRVR